MSARHVALAAGALYLANAAVGVRTALRDGLAAEPLGIRTGIPVHWDALVGNGSALSAPPPMLVVLGYTLRRAARGDRRALAGLAGLGTVFLAGMVAEPITHDVARAPTAHLTHTSIVAANLVLPAAMVVAALRELATCP